MQKVGGGGARNARNKIETKRGYKASHLREMQRRQG